MNLKTKKCIENEKKTTKISVYKYNILIKGIQNGSTINLILGINAEREQMEFENGNKCISITGIN